MGIIAAILGPGLSQFVHDMASILHGVLWFADPANWMRIIAGVFGFLFLIAGLIFMVKAA